MKLKYNELIFDVNGDVNLDNYYSKSECDNKYAKLNEDNNFSKNNTFNNLAISSNDDESVKTILKISTNNEPILQVNKDYLNDIYTGVDVHIIGQGSLVLSGGETGRLKYFENLKNSSNKKDLVNDNVILIADKRIYFHLGVDDGNNDVDPNTKIITMLENGFIEVPSSALTPTSNNYLASKKYVDDQINKLKASL